MALRRLHDAVAPRGEDETHEYCFHTLRILSRSQAVQIENADPGRQLREAAARKYLGARRHSLCSRIE